MIKLNLPCEMITQEEWMCISSSALTTVVARWIPNLEILNHCATVNSSSVLWQMLYSRDPSDCNNRGSRFFVPAPYETRFFCAWLWFNSIMGKHLLLLLTIIMMVWFDRKKNHEWMDNNSSQQARVGKINHLEKNINKTTFEKGKFSAVLHTICQNANS